LERALKLLDEEYFGREQEFYEKLCKKYNIKAENEYVLSQYNVPSVSEILQEDELIICAQCQERYRYSEFPDAEWKHGYYLACKQCCAEKDNITTLRWHNEYHSPNCVLEQDREILGCSASDHKYALVDMKPVCKGVHCWRWHTKSYQTWFLWGISSFKKFSNSSYNEATVWGIAGNNQSYRNGSTRHELTAHFFSSEQILLDMLLDLNKGELSFQKPGSAYVVKLDSIPEQKEGWVPHVNIYYTGTKCQVKKIPPAWFGKNPAAIKF